MVQEKIQRTKNQKKNCKKKYRKPVTGFGFLIIIRFMYSIVFPKTIEAITRIRNKRKSCKVYNENVKEKMNKKKL